jgi:hypothetical protein
MNETKTEIKRNKDPLLGPLDGVEAELKCAFTEFGYRENLNGDGAKILSMRGIELKEKVATRMEVHPCRVMCSYSEGTVSFSVRGIDVMTTVRLDELIQIMRAASEAHIDFTSTLPKGETEHTDEEIEARWRELVHVQPIEMLDADSPSGRVTSDRWWIFPKGADCDEILKWFETHHSDWEGFLEREKELFN